MIYLMGNALIRIIGDEDANICVLRHVSPFIIDSEGHVVKDNEGNPKLKAIIYQKPSDTLYTDGITRIRKWMKY
jgi:hypothetical protein